MSVTGTVTVPALSTAGAVVERHWQELASRRRLYTDQALNYGRAKK